MESRKETIKARIAELERANQDNGKELDALKQELADLPDDKTKEAIEDKNAYLRRAGLLPTQ